MSLREEAVEALAVAMAMSGVETEKRVGALTEAAEAALDGLVAYLREHLESWLDEAYLPKQDSGLLPDVDDLLAVLGGDS